MLGTALVSLLSLSACNYITGGADNSEPPMSLSSIEAEKEFVAVWSSKVGSGNKGQYLHLKPLVLADKVMTVDAEGHLRATNASDGSLIWQKKLNTKITQGVAGSTDKIFISTDNGTILAFSTTNGEKIWQKELNKNILNNPSYDQNNLFVQATDGTLYSLSAKDGKTNWDYKTSVPDLTLYATSSPLVWKDKVITGFANGKLYAFNKYEGTPIWDYQITLPSGQSSIQRMVDISSQPIIRDGYIYAVSYQGNVVALDLDTGNLMWERKLSSISDMAVNTKYLYVSDTEGTVWALNRTSGRVLWKQPNLYMRQLSGTSFIDDTILVGDYEGYVHGLSYEHGGFIARANIGTDGIRVAPIVKNGIIYILDNSGKLAAYKLSSKTA